MKAHIHTKLSQKAGLSQGMQQTIQLISLPTLALREHLLQAVQQNPFLELDELDDASWQQPINARISDTYRDVDDEWITQIKSPETLRDTLIWQSGLVHWNAEEELIAQILIDSIDEAGYLTASLSELFPYYGSDRTQALLVDSVLHRIQYFEPTGVGARDLQECLDLQLKALDNNDIIVVLARRIIAQYFDALIKHDDEAIAAGLYVDKLSCKTALNLIQSLDPKPGYQVCALVPELIIPDLILVEDEGTWKVQLYEHTLPPVRLHKEYAKTSANALNPSLSGYLQEAKQLLQTLQIRGQTLLLIGKAIMLKQDNFITQGHEALKPLTLEDLSQLTAYHVSSLSRLTRQKYIHTPRGIFELKYFLSGGIRTQTGEDIASMAVKATIAALIAQEDHEQPYTDAALVSELKARGISIARRTVAKYRDVLNIPPYSQRKSMY